MLGAGTRAHAAEADAVAAADPLADDDQAANGFPDPFEPFNRAVLRMNLGVDHWFIDPVARGYAFVVPSPARRAIRRALDNLNAPAVFVNDVLQLHPKDAGVTVGRFVLNTTVGVAGLFDPASKVGLDAHDNDFGSTLSLAGMPSGPYLMLPIVGPTTARDGTGFLVDFLFRPTTYILTPGAQIVFTSVEESTAGIAARDAHSEGLRALQESSIDYYAALRNAFYQNRVAEIASHKPAATQADLALR
jgi:phospholipid-binding lipoprotein MlaA